MPYNSIQMDGVLGGGVEAWSVGLKFASSTSTGVSNATDLGAWANSIMGLWASAASWATTLRDPLGTNGTISRVRTYYHLSPGAPAAVSGISTAASVTGSGTITLPPQVSIVCSLSTGLPGRSFRGRLYWPCVAGGVTTTLKRGGTPSTSTLATAFAQMLDAVADAAPGALGLRPVVVSEAASAITPVINVSVGDVYDTQRRRRDALIETRSVAAIP